MKKVDIEDMIAESLSNLPRYWYKTFGYKVTDGMKELIEENDKF